MLKAVIPPPLLKSCLDSMSVRNEGDVAKNDSDSDDDAFVSKKKKKAKTTTKTSDMSLSSVSNGSEAQEYSMTVRVKLGRNGNTTLYYLNQSKLENEGDGLDAGERHKLVAAEQHASEALKNLFNECKSMQQETTKLLSESKNEELDTLLREKEDELNCVKGDLTNAQGFKENASRRKNLKRRVDKMASQWFQRKRKCLDFLDMMEENTEGIVSKKKCLSGKGQIEVESDEACVKQAKEFFARKRGLSGLTGEKDKASSFFIGVLSGPRATVIRVNAD